MTLKNSLLMVFAIGTLFATGIAKADTIECKEIQIYQHPNWVPTGASVVLQSTSGPEWTFKTEAPGEPSLTGQVTPQLFGAPIDREFASIAEFVYPNKTLASYEGFELVPQGDDSTGVTLFRLRNEKGEPYGVVLQAGWGVAKCGNL